MIQPIILSGGSGSRLWPLSRSSLPKQFLALLNDNSLLQNTVKRCEVFTEKKSPIVICNHQHRFDVAEQLLQIGVDQAQIILEPIGRNTAPAIAIAAFHLLNNNQDPIMLVLPSDHFIDEVPLFQQAVLTATPLAEQDQLVTFGVIPTSPHTGYGYIHAGEKIKDDCFKVDKFIEKPNLAKAKSYLAERHYYWNSGMFLFKASTYLNALKNYANDIYEQCYLVSQQLAKDLDFVRIPENPFEFCRSESIDYAIMEKTDKAMVVPLKCTWSDIGSYEALHEWHQADDYGNVKIGNVHLHNVHNSYVHSESRLLTAVGVNDHVIIETKDAVLVTHKDSCQDVKMLVNELIAKGSSEALFHKRIYRPWGNYESMDHGEKFQVKRITVKPGKRLSLQMHQHRCEHWIVVEGTATVTKDNEVFTLNTNESTYIPQGCKHRMENLTNQPLHIIEVQSGSYLGEDDIVRYEDDFGRVEETVA